MKYILISIFLYGITSYLPAVEIVFQRVDQKNAAKVEVKPQDPKKFPGRGDGNKKKWKGPGRGRDK